MSAVSGDGPVAAEAAQLLVNLVGLVLAGLLVLWLRPALGRFWRALPGRG